MSAIELHGGWNKATHISGMNVLTLLRALKDIQMLLLAEPW
jgi:hypothetical protein